MVDVYGNIYKAPATTLNSYSTTYYKVPVDGFADEKGNKPDFNKITQMRIYPDTNVVGGCFWFDEFGFTNDSPYISSITSDIIATGVSSEADAITVDFINNNGENKEFTLIAAIYNKTDMSLYDIALKTGEVTAENISITLDNIVLPEEDKENYMLKFFIWEDGENMLEHKCEYYLPAVVNY